MAEARDRKAWDRTAQLTHFIAAGLGVKRKNGQPYTLLELNPYTARQKPKVDFKLGGREGVEFIVNLIDGNGCR